MPIGRCALFKQHLARLADHFLAMLASQSRSSSRRPCNGKMRSMAAAISSGGVGDAGAVTVGESIRVPPGCTSRIADLVFWRCYTKSVSSQGFEANSGRATVTLTRLQPNGMIARFIAAA